MIYASMLPREQVTLAMDTRKALETARLHIEERNYGIADDWIEEALKLLPIDTGEGGIVWPELEERTS